MEQTQGNTGSFNAVEYGPGQAARDDEALSKGDS